MGWRKYVACDSTKSLITFYRGRFTLGLNSDTILEDLTSYDVRHLIMMEDENTQTKVLARPYLELESNPRKYFTERAPNTRAFSLLKSPTSAFTNTQVPKHSKQT